MKTHRLYRISRALGLVIFASGCEILWSQELDKCARTASCESLRSMGEGGGTATGCVPSENAAVVGDGCGVFVSKSGNDGSAGTKAEPVKTLAEAIARAAEKGTAVYACAEEFAEAAEVPAGVTVFGGLDCAGEWTWIGETKKTIVAPDVEAIPLKLAGGEGTTRIEDLVARASDAQAPGASSIAVLVDGAKAEFARCELVAGSGADGAKGEDAPSDAPMQALSGNSGTNACSDRDGTGGPDATLPGGAQVENACGAGTLSVGGRGGDGNVSNGGGGDTGQVGSEGLGGAGEPVSMTSTWNCGAIPGDPDKGGGNAGVNGTPGDAGLAASGLGALSSSGYAGVSGGEGTTGKPGQGGGGGGGAKGGSLLCGGGAGAGASGGSGGAGGCGGLPGKGGGAGGASIALASVQATVTLKDCKLTAGSGGKGGAGGALQPGALGGLPGQGGAGINGSNPGCDGGRGGKGGNGGPGGGGLGGHSLALAFQGMPVAQQGKMVVTPGAAGVGGPGGSNNAGMNVGAEGIAAAEQELP